MQQPAVVAIASQVESWVLEQPVSHTACADERTDEPAPQQIWAAAASQRNSLCPKAAQLQEKVQAWPQCPPSSPSLLLRLFVPLPSPLLSVVSVRASLLSPLYDASY